MLSKVLKDPAPDARPVAWRSGAAVPVKADVPPPKVDVPAEVTELRARLAQLTADLQKQAREAYEAGRKAGEEAARQGQEAEVREAVQNFATAVSEVASMRAETIHRAEVDTVRLAIEIARRILHRELSVDTSALEALIKAALEKLQAQEVYRVRVHPDQAKIVRSCLDQMGRSQAIEVIHDPSQQKGGAVFEISRGALDASVETQLREIECGLTDRLEARV